MLHIQQMLADHAEILGGFQCDYFFQEKAQYLKEISFSFDLNETAVYFEQTSEDFCIRTFLKEYAQYHDRLMQNGYHFHQYPKKDCPSFKIPKKCKKEENHWEKMILLFIMILTVVAVVISFVVRKRLIQKKFPNFEHLKH